VREIGETNILPRLGGSAARPTIDRVETVIGGMHNDTDRDRSNPR
jgi:hypothetical protein